MNMSDDLAVTLERLTRVVQNETHTAGLKPVQWEALRYLGRANRFSRNPSAVAGYLGITKGTVSQTLIALERKGLIRKHAGAGDRRNVHLELTDDGTALLRDDPVSLLVDSAADLAAEDRRTLAAGLQSILRRALQRHGRRPFGQCRTCHFFRKNAAEGAPHGCDLLGEPLSVDDSERICAEHQLAG